MLRPQGRCAAEERPLPSRRGCFWKVRPSTSVSQRWQTPSRGTLRRAALRAVAGRRRHATATAERVPRECAPLVSALAAATDAVDHVSVLPRTPKSSRRGTRGDEPSGFRRWQCVWLEAVRPRVPRGRCVGVNAAAAGASGPGIRTSAEQMRPSSKGPRPRCDRLRAGRMRSAELLLSGLLPCDDSGLLL